MNENGPRERAAPQQQAPTSLEATPLQATLASYAALTAIARSELGGCQWEALVGIAAARIAHEYRLLMFGEGRRAA
jgi:hypothetical protein